MTTEDQLSELREHVRELQELVVSIIPDERVALLDELNLLRMTIAERTGTQGFVLQRRYLEGGRYGFFVRSTQELTRDDVVAYVGRLRRLGMQIEVEAMTAVTP
jgi:hypothetical protein